MRQCYICLSRGKKKQSNEKQLSADGLATDSTGENPVTSAVSKTIGSGPDNEKKQARLLAPRYVAVNSKNQVWSNASNDEMVYPHVQQ